MSDNPLPPSFKLARLPSSISFICRYWSQPVALSRPINFKKLP